MVRTFQLTKALNRMTVMDNMMLGATGQRGESLLASMVRPLWSGQEREIEEKAKDLLQRFKLLEKKEDYAGSLSGGQRKLLEMARALMTNPKMIMLDEPMAGVNPALTQSLLGHIQSLRDEGMTVLFVEHDMHVVRHISDWVVVMAEGQIVAEGSADTVMSNPAVIDAYLGAHHDTDLGDETLLEEETLHAYEAEAQAEEEQHQPHHGRRPCRARPEGQHVVTTTPSTSPSSAVEQPGEHPAGRDRGPRRRRGLPARGQHPQQLQPGGLPRRDDRHHRPQRRRQVHAAQGHVRPGEGRTPAA